MPTLRTFVMILLALHASRAYSCTPPLPENQESVLEAVDRRYDTSKNVVVAHVQKAVKTTVKRGGIDFPLPAERITFRVQKVFKGSLAVGETFVITTVLGGCGRSVENYYQAVGDNAAPGAPILEWLIYMNSPRDVQITSASYTKPLGIAADDIARLSQKLRRRKEGADH